MKNCFKTCAVVVVLVVVVRLAVAVGPRSN